MGPPEIIQKFRLRNWPIPSADLPIEGTEHHFGPFLGEGFWSCFLFSWEKKKPQKNWCSESNFATFQGRLDWTSLFAQSFKKIFSNLRFKEGLKRGPLCAYENGHFGSSFSHLRHKTFVREKCLKKDKVVFQERSLFERSLNRTASVLPLPVCKGKSKHINLFEHKLVGRQTGTHISFRGGILWPKKVPLTGDLGPQTVEYIVQEPRKEGLSKGGFCRVRCHNQGNKKYPRILGPAAHLALRALQPREVYILQKPPSKDSLFLVPE